MKQFRQDATREVEQCDANLPGDCPQARRVALVLRGVADALDGEGDEAGEAPALEAPSGANADASQPSAPAEASPAEATPVEATPVEPGPRSAPEPKRG